jgi:hypothetical protein
MRIVYALVACLLLEGCAHAADSKSMSNSVPGGWSAVAVDDAKVKIAAQRAVSVQGSIEKAELKLVSIDDAQRQVVAGINYKLRLSLTKGPQQRKASATVWAKLDGTYELTAWSWD